MKKWMGILFLGVLIIVVVSMILNMQTKLPEQQNDTFTFSETEFDFGMIKQNGGLVSHDFAFTYKGTTERKVIGVVGSCGCTTGEINLETLTPGSEGIMTVTFDPNLHEEPDGRFYKTVSLLTEPLIDEDIEVKIWAEIDLDLGPEFFTLTSLKNEVHYDEHSSQDYGEIHVPELKERLVEKDFFLLDVHIPEQTHIEQTDAFIPFNEIESYVDELPTDKDTEIIAYCRSGSMSQVAAQTLIDMGYTNVSYLEGGVTEFNKLIYMSS